MNLKRLILIGFVLSQFIDTKCQTVDFFYDENGNRTSRILTVEQLKSGSTQFPVINTKDLKLVEDVQEQKSEESEIEAMVYPNPTKGVLHIDISNMPLNSKSELRIYDLSGVQLIIKRNFGEAVEVDMTQFKDGLYILRLKVNKKVFDWKVVKNH